MAGVSYHIDDAEVKRKIGGILKRLDNAEPGMKLIGETALESIQRNFEEGGRPRKWKRLAPSTRKARKRKGKWPGKILMIAGAAGGLFGTISYKAYSDKVVMIANKVYAAIHHFGGMAGRGKKVKIPARPFMMIQDEDWREMKEELSQFILRG